MRRRWLAPRRARALLASVLLVVSATVMPIAAAGAAPTLAGPRGAFPFALELALSGYDRPLAAVSDGAWRRLFIVEQTGRIHVATRTSADGPWTKQGVFLDLRDLVTGPFVGRGLLALAFHPDYATNGRFYVYYTRKSSTESYNGDAVLAEYRRSSPLRADPSSRRWMLVLDQPTQFHFGGWLAFGPDEMLYLSTGDGTRPGVYPQDTSSRLGKLLRIDPTDPPGSARFRIPPDNPFVGRPGDDAVWAYGFRNPWRGSFDRLTGALWLGDVGSSRYEEVDRAPSANGFKGRNYGWPICEGRHEYDPDASPPAACTTPGLTLPPIEYSHAGSACSVIGGYVYRGRRQDSIRGRYFFGDYCTGQIWRVPNTYAAGDPIAPAMDTQLLITSFGEDSLGELYVVGAHGTVHHIVGR